MDKLNVCLLIQIPVSARYCSHDRRCGVAVALVVLQYYNGSQTVLNASALFFKSCNVNISSLQ